ncbi:probable inactive receptor kinase At5g10020 [Chenopodium quinoa]|nr:probable inactive receptor kinase At5g10020 [Chenopodium quinoa]
MFFSSRSSNRSSINNGGLIFPIFSLLILIIITPSLVFCNSDEVRALLEFKKGIHEDPLGKVIPTWNATAVVTASDLDSCPTSFHGVVCDDASNSVVAISLDGLNLSGELKFSTLIGLKMLQNLNLRGNNFTGRLVPQLGSMNNLQILDLSDNWFIGRIPERIHDLWNLQHLNLSNNQFSGGYPIGIRNLQQLRVLDVHANELWGDIGVFFSELRNVEFVDLSMNRFSGGLPVDSSNVSSLGNTIRHMNLSSNLLGGKFLTADTLSLFQSLVVLDLGDNMIGGELPSFGSLYNLRVLRLRNNQLYGEVPGELLATLIQLKELDLSGNGFSGSIRGINSTTLEILDLSSNRLSGSFPEFSSQSGLTTLRISNNSLEGSLPSEWRQFAKLSKIDLSINNLAGRIPSALFSLNLRDLNLSKNHFNGAIPFPESTTVGEFLAQPVFAPLESLDLSDNSLVGDLSKDIGLLGRLRSLNLAKNSLSGHIPNSLVNIDGLESLDLSNNQFKGHLPGKLPPNLKLLNVTYNDLSGTVPESLRAFPPSSFHPGNEKLYIPGDEGSPGGGSNYVYGKNGHRGSKSSIKIAIILASVGAALMIAFVALAYYRSQHHGSSKYNGATTGRDVKVGRFTRPSLFKFNAGPEPSDTSLSFSNTHLLPSNSRTLSGQAELVPEFADRAAAASSTSYVKPNLPDNPMVTSARKSPPGSPHSSSPRFFETFEQPVTLDVYSPDRFAGELYFLDTSLAFTAEQLSRAPAEVLGRSSHGTLYKATLNGGHMLTVKWLRVGLVKNKKEFAKEVKKIGLMRHPNIAPVRAYYWGPREQERLILSDYINGDSLALHLYESTPRRYSLLSFTQRLKVAVDVARCLVYLHDRGMPHGNLKPTNVILAGPDLSAWVTDYGLHRLMMPAGVAEQILNLGALGYCAPELSNASKPMPSLKADVYAFGVIVMEILTRRSAGDIISGQSGAVDLTDWVRLCDQEGRRGDCIDRDIAGGSEPSQAMDDMLVISLRCILPVNERPNIRQVYEDLCSIAG